MFKICSPLTALRKLFLPIHYRKSYPTRFISADFKIWYFDEGIRSFSFLTDKDEIFGFFGSVLFIAIIPIGIFYWLNDKEKYEERAKAISLLGFLPAFAVLGFIVFY
jgi:hypothetical protein